MNLEQETRAFGEWLNKKMLDSGLTGVQLAQRSGTSAAYISQLRRGAKTNPSKETIQKLAEGLEVAPQEITSMISLSESGQPAKPNTDPRPSRPLCNCRFFDADDEIEVRIGQESKTLRLTIELERRQQGRPSNGPTEVQALALSADLYVTKDLPPIACNVSNSCLELQIPFELIRK